MLEGRVHFIGMGGVGMSALARILLSMGVEVSGSDIQRNRLLDQLEGLGARVYIGHRAEQVGNARLVVYSTAIKENNPELLEARRRGIPVVHRGEMLARIMAEKEGVAVAGSHGKTTTSALVAAILIEAGWEPTVLVGGRLLSMDTNALLGQGRLIVAEADESDGSFLHLHPHYAVVTNVDREHLDHYGDFYALVKAFESFLDRVQDMAVVCWDDALLREMVGQGRVTYGSYPGAQYRAVDVKRERKGQSFLCVKEGRELGRVRIRLPGGHNVLNALGALALSLEMGVEWSRAVEALATFAGVDRRLTPKGEARGVLVVDDYGHHPTEIKCTLQAARQEWPERRLVVVFQPHRYSRTRALLEEFWRSFSDTDSLVVMEIYSAGESPNGVTGMDLWRGVKKESCPQALFLPTREEVVNHLLGILREGDLLVTLGAGDVWRVGMQVLEALEGK